MHGPSYIENCTKLSLKFSMDQYGLAFDMEYVFSESGPEPAEILTVVNVAENKYALKTGYGRYVSVNTAGELTGRAEAIGPRETWEPVFEEVCLCVCVRVLGEKERESIIPSLTGQSGSVCLQPSVCDCRY